MPPLDLVEAAFGADTADRRAERALGRHRSVDAAAALQRAPIERAAGHDVHERTEEDDAEREHLPEAVAAEELRGRRRTGR